jgi:hypothetical protein
MALTWREERPEAITAASHSADRPSRSMVTIFSALLSSSEVRIRFRRSLGGAGFLTGATAGFLGATFFAGFFTGFFAGFLAGFLTSFLTVFLADFLAGAFFAAFALAAGFLAALRVRAQVL